MLFAYPSGVFSLWLLTYHYAIIILCSNSRKKIWAINSRWAPSVMKSSTRPCSSTSLPTSSRSLGSGKAQYPTVSLSLLNCPGGQYRKLKTCYVAFTRISRSLNYNFCRICWPKCSDCWSSLWMVCPSDWSTLSIGTKLLIGLSSTKKHWIKTCIQILLIRLFPETRRRNSSIVISL